MIDQYKNETAQIHAPMALIEKTMAAVREEEARIEREQSGQIPDPVSQVSYADYTACQKKYSWRNWTYPLTAAAAVVLLLSISLTMRGVWTNRVTKDQMAADGAMMTEEASAADGGTGAEMMEETESGAADSTAGELSQAAQDGMEDAVPKDMENVKESVAEKETVPKKMESVDGAVTESALEQESSGAASEASAEDYAKQRDMIQNEAEKEEVEPFRSVKDNGIRIKVIEEKPPFYDNPQAQDMVYEGLTFRVMKEEEGWIAYVETADGTAYMINGAAEELDDFLKEGFEELEKKENSQS